MRKVILQEFVSLDGLAAGPKNSVDFVPKTTKGDRRFGDEQVKLIESVDIILLGSVTYRMFSEYWPNVKNGEEKPFADKLNATPKIVFSSTLTRAPWGTWDDATVLKGSAVKEVATLKRQSGKDLILWGSISVAQALMTERLIDEFRLVVCPVVLGEGRPLFRDDLDAYELQFRDAKTFDRGAVLLTYLS
jgi:dihydrofolate reductase